MLAEEDRLLASGEESGTAPGDRRFRPDVEGLRAVAVLLVVVYHAGLLRVTGGFVGVDVFFVISGFVITGVLLRERAATGRTSLLDFYARRVRRILPAATLVLLVTVLCTYLLLGVVSGDSAADDGRWAAVFLANFHFASIGTDYLTATRPPSPLQNYWSLSVEEQFYLVFPTLFLVVTRVRGRSGATTRLLTVLALIMASSFWLSVVQTASSPTRAYFSPLTRAWELALGAMLAVATPWLTRVPARIGAAATWVGLGAILVSAFAFTDATAYPGSLVAVPVLGSALVIGGGVQARRAGAEGLLGTGPFQWVGRRSYGLYLWHWPVLVLAAEYAGKTTLPAGESTLLVLAALVLTACSYRIVENPLRHLRRPSRATVLSGGAVVVVTVVALTLAIDWVGNGATGGPRAVVPAPTETEVLRQVAAAPSITSVPATLQPSLVDASSNYGGYYAPQFCVLGPTQTWINPCILGDTAGKGLLVVYGDSHAVMWLPAFQAIAERARMRLVVLAKVDCPAGFVTVTDPPGLRSPTGPYTECDRWHQRVVQWVNQVHPTMVVVTQRYLYPVASPTGGPPAYPDQATWEQGMRSLLDAVHLPATAKVVLGDIPARPVDPSICLSQHRDDVQACSTPVVSSPPSYWDVAEMDAAHAVGARYLEVTPWFCSSVCTNIVKHFAVYLDQFHMTADYAIYLERVLGQSLGLPGS